MTSVIPFQAQTTADRSTSESNLVIKKTHTLRGVLHSHQQEIGVLHSHQQEIGVLHFNQQEIGVLHSHQQEIGVLHFHQQEIAVLLCCQIINMCAMEELYSTRHQIGTIVDGT